jgi:hypothetical protein
MIHRRELLLFFQFSKPLWNQFLRPLGILGAYPGFTRYENHHSGLIMIQAALCTINYTCAYTEGQLSVIHFYIVAKLPVFGVKSKIAGNNQNPLFLNLFIIGKRIALTHPFAKPAAGQTGQ